MAAAAFDYHVSVLLQIDVCFVEEIQDRNRTEFSWSATGLRHFRRLHQMDESLHNSVVCRIHVRVQWEIAFATAVECAITVRCDDPILPFEVLETDVQRLNLTTLMVVDLTWLEQWISHFRLLTASHSIPLGSLRMLHWLHNVLALEVTDHERLVFIVSFSVYETDVVEFDFVLWSANGMRANVQASILFGTSHPS